MLIALILSVIDGGALNGTNGWCNEDDLGLKQSSRRIRSRALKLQSRRDAQSSERLEKLSDSIQQRISILSSTFQQDQVPRWSSAMLYIFFLKYVLKLNGLKGRGIDLLTLSSLIEDTLYTPNFSRS